MRIHFHFHHSHFGSGLKFVVWSPLGVAQNHPVKPRDRGGLVESEEVCLVWKSDFAES